MLFLPAIITPYRAQKNLLKYTYGIPVKPIAKIGNVSIIYIKSILPMRFADPAIKKGRD